MSKLRSFLDDGGIRKSDFADKLGISRGYLSELIGGSKLPSLEVAVRIQRQTGGAVTAESWFPEALISISKVETVGGSCDHCSDKTGAAQ